MLCHIPLFAYLCDHNQNQYKDATLMQKIYLFVVAVAMTVAAQAQAVGRSTVATPLIKNHTTQQKACSFTEPVTEQPAGTLYKNMYRTLSAYYVFFNDISYTHEDGTLGDVVVADNGDIYIKNPISQLRTNTWIKGTKGVGDTINVELPQVVYKEADEDTTVYYSVFKMDFISNDEGQGYVPSDNQTMKFVWHRDSLIKVDDALLGLADAVDSIWCGYGETKMEFSVCKDQTISAPDTSKATDFAVESSMSGSNYKDVKIVKTVIDGNDIYLNRLCVNLPDAWVKGRIEGSKAVFPAKQYMGVDTVRRSHVYFMPERIKQYYASYWDEPLDSIYLLDEIVFDYDADKGTLKTDSSMATNQGKNTADNITLYRTPQLTTWQEEVATPKDPFVTDFGEYDKSYGYGYAKFRIEKYSTDGKPLDDRKMYYNVYFDLEKQTFYPDDYLALTDEMTDVPCTYKDYEDFYISGNIYSLYYHAMGFKQFGVQVFYTGGGQTKKSNLVWYNKRLAAIDNTIADGQQKVVSTTFTDLSGRRIDNPTKGLYIVTTKYADGKTKNELKILN